MGINMIFALSLLFCVGVKGSFSGLSDGVLQIPISYWPRKITIQYELNKIQFDRFFEISSTGFFRLLPYVNTAKGRGFDIRSLPEDNFSEKILSTARIKAPPTLIVYGSTPSSQKYGYIDLEPIRAGRFLVGFANSESYHAHLFKVLKTDFLVLAPKSVSGFDPNKFEKVIRQSWPIYLARFPCPTKWAVFHDDPDSPLGASPTGSNVFAFGYNQTVSPEIQAVLEKYFGLARRDSSDGYFKELMTSSTDPIDEYWTTIINHELGHLFFGFGTTTELHILAHEYWMSLGIGLAVDERVTQQIIGHPTELYDRLVIDFWQNQLFKLPIDQRLESPDLTSDVLYGVTSVNRLQHYGHGKSLVFWRRVEEAIGTQRFDEFINKFVATGGAKGGYLEIRPALLQAFPQLPQLEQQLKIL